MTATNRRRLHIGGRARDPNRGLPVSNREVRRLLALAAVVVAWAGCTGPTPQDLPRPVPSGASFPLTPRPPCDVRLAAAVQGNDAGAVRQLIAAGVTPNCGAQDYPTALSEAILHDRVEVVRALLEGGASPDLRWNAHGDRLPLQDVIEGEGFGMRQRHRAEMLALLIRHGADVNARWCPFESRLPVYRGVGAGRTMVMPACGAATGVTALQTAARLGRADAVAQLLAAGADGRWEDHQRLTAIELAATEDVFGVIVVRRFGSEAAAVADYQRRRSRFEAPALRGATMLAAAVSHRFYGWTRLELSGSADPDRVEGNASGMTALQLAVVNGWAEGVALLLDFGADIEGRSCPDHRWLGGYHASQVDMTGCDPARGLTPLMIAAATRTPVGVFGEDRSFGLMDSTAVDWKGRTSRRHAELAGVDAQSLHNYGPDPGRRSR